MTKKEQIAVKQLKKSEINMELKEFERAWHNVEGRGKIVKLDNGATFYTDKFVVFKENGVEVVSFGLDERGEAYCKLSSIVKVM